MPLIPKPNYNQIFASQAPEQDKPAVFNNYPLGWGVESRPNNGKPTIKGFNYLQQTSDLKDLWILQNGACLPYDESIEYAEGAPVLKDGVIQYKTADGFKSRDSVTIPTYNNAADGVDPVTGVADGAYYNVRSSSDESYVDEYQNVGGVPTPSGKSYPSSGAVQKIADYTALPFVAGESYDLHKRVQLDNGDIVKNTIDGNTTDPNVDMTGWRLADPALNAQKLKRDFISVWDFFTKSEEQAYNLAVLNGAPESFDSYRPTQEFLDHISQNYYSNAYFIGRFWVSSGLSLVSSNSNRTTNITGSPTITATTAIDTVFNIDYGQDFVWNGILKLRGTGDQVYSRRTCNHGLKIGGTASRARFKGVVASNFKQTGIYAYAGSTLGDFGDVRVNNTGSGFTSQPTYNLSSTFSNPVNSGTSGNTSQYTTITVATLPPEDLITECMVSISGQPYYVQAIDRANNTLQIFPWLDLNNTETNLTYIFGAGVYMTSGDASVLRFSEIDATRCGVAVWHGSLYPPIIDALVTQYCGVGQILGIYPTRAMVGGQVNGYYCENNNIDLLKLTRSETIGFYISSQYAFNYAKVKYAGSPRDTNNALLTQYANLNGVSIADYNGLKSFEKYPRGFLASTLGINVTNLTSRYMIYSGNSKNINIGTPNLDVHNAFGYDSYALVYVGTNGNAPTGTFTFNAPSGYTVNGQSSVSFSNFSSTAVFHIIWQVSISNFVVSCSGQAPVSLLASVTYDPPSIAAGATETTTVTLAGASVGNIVQAAFSKYSADIDITAVVSAANTVTVKFKNTGSTAVDMASGTLTVKLI